MLTLTLICLFLTKSIYSQTLWVYDSTEYRAILNAKPSINPTDKGVQTLSECKSQCDSLGLSCLSFIWAGDIKTATSTSKCNIFKTRFGFVTSGFDKTDDNFGEGDKVFLISADGTTYFEKPMDSYASDVLGDHLILNALRLNNKNYNNYKNQVNNRFNYDQFLLYYRDGIPGYVNNSDSQSSNKYSVIKEIKGVEGAEECAKYCTRNRGAIDEQLGTRCVSFNYNTDGTCHLLTFSAGIYPDPVDGYDTEDLETSGYNIGDMSDRKTGWFYYEGLLGDGCWIVQSQCRKWDDAQYVSDQEANNNTYKTGKDVGIIRQYAHDPICSKCTNSQDFNKEFEYICLSKARDFHEDFCDNNADSATVAYWAQDGAGVAEIWNSWDLTTGCVIDLTPFECIPDLTKYPDAPYPNPRFAGRIFRDSIGEEEFAAGVDKKRCWARGEAWYNYCGLADQGKDGETVYLKVAWPSDGSFYLEPAIPCECDEYGLKIEKDFGMMRDYCTRKNTVTEEWCYRESQEDFYNEPDILCDDLTSSYTCDIGAISSESTGCYLFYPQPTELAVLEGKSAINFECSGGGRYNFKDDEFTEVNSVKYKEIMCNEQKVNNNCGEWTVDICKQLAEEIHNSCGNDLEDSTEIIIVWYRPTGDIMTFPYYQLPFETTVSRGFLPTAAYTSDPQDTIIDLMPIRNGRWQTFKPVESGNLRQLDVYYTNTIAADLTCTIWNGNGITESIFLNQVKIEGVNATDEGFVRFPLDNITLTAGEVYTWQITSISDDPTLVGDLGYVRGNWYKNGVGDLAWDYLFVAWVEGQLDTDASMIADVIPQALTRPWFEIWCIMIIILFLIFLVFLCILHWKRKYDEEQEKKEDKKFQAELRQRAMLQAQAERNAKNGIEEDDGDEYDDDDYDSREVDGNSVSDYDEEEKFNKDDIYENEPDEYNDEEFEQQQKKNNNLLAPSEDKNYARVKSYSKNEMPGYDKDDGDGYHDEDEPKKKKKKKKKKKRHEDADYTEY